MVLLGPMIDVRVKFGEQVIATRWIGRMIEQHVRDWLVLSLIYCSGHTLLVNLLIALNN